MAAPRYQFPQDLGSSTQGHWMLITAKQPGDNNNLNQVAADTTGTSVALFMPGGVNGNIIVTSIHEYNEMKLTKVIVDGITSAAPLLGAGIQAAAGAAPMIGGAINPKVEVLYRSTGLRDFQFSFIMAPT